MVGMDLELHKSKDLLIDFSIHCCDCDLNLSLY